MTVAIAGFFDHDDNANRHNAVSYFARKRVGTMASEGEGAAVQLVLRSEPRSHNRAVTHRPRK